MTKYNNKTIAALHYAKMGYYPIPMLNIKEADGSITKRPAAKFKDAPRLTENDIIKIWEAHPNWNVALRTVDQLVIDVDVHTPGVDGYKQIEKLTRKEWWPKTLTATTPTGGKHYVFSKIPDLDVTQKINVFPGVDVKAHINNYFMVFPSTAGNGNMYIWDNWNEFKMVKPTEAPKELYEALGLIKDPAANKVSNGGNFSTSGQNKTSRMFETLVAGLGDEGERNTNLATLVGYLLKVGVDPSIALILAQQANNKTGVQLPQNEFEATFASILRLHLSNNH